MTAVVAVEAMAVFRALQVVGKALAVTFLTPRFPAGATFSGLSTDYRHILLKLFGLFW